MRELLKTLETYRLILRPFEKTDLEEFYQYASVPGVGEMAGWSHHKSIEESKVILDAFLRTNVFAIVEKETGHLIGSLGLEKNSVEVIEYSSKKGIEFGYVISKEYQNKGYCTEAVREVLRYLICDLEYEYFTLGFFKENIASKRIAEKCGFKYYCDFVYHTSYGKSFDSTIMLLDAKSYFKKREYYQLYDKNMNPLELKLLRGTTIPQEAYWGIVEAVTYNKRNQKILVTKRSSLKQTFPGYLEVTVGAMEYKEEPRVSILRELEEEVGVFNPKLIFLKKQLHVRAVSFCFLAVVDIDIDSIQLEEYETEAYYWYSLEEFIALLQKDEMVSYQKNRIIQVMDQVMEEIKKC